VAIARAMLHRPRVLILDEAESGLDPASLNSLQGMLRGFIQTGGCVIAASHNLDFALHGADRIAVLANGRFELEAPAGSFSIDELKQTISGRKTGPL